MKAWVLLLVALLPGAALTGCIGGGDDAPPVEPTAADTDDDRTLASNATLPDGREFKAASEVNKTEEGEGGTEHLHDYWHGAESVIIYDREVRPGLVPIGERGDTSSLWIAFINLEKLPSDETRDALVFEGTGEVEFTITKAPAWAQSFDLTFRTAATDWSSRESITVGEPFFYKPTQTETDMPHSFRSLWNWKLYAKSPVPVTGEPFAFAGEAIHVQITVRKLQEVADWPGHPDFYAGVTERKVMDDLAGTTNVQQAGDVVLYGVEPDQLVAEKLISMGSHTLDIYVNITRLALPPGVESDGFYLFWRDAATRPNALGNGLMNNETDGSTWAYFHVQLDPERLDSPYQPESRFTFKLLVAPANSDVVICYRCMPYEIDYEMTVIARPHPDGHDMDLM